MKILITGIGGFVGGHLAERLSRASHDLFGTVRPGKSQDALSTLKLTKPVSLHEIDLGHDRAIASLIGDVRPYAVVHLAAYAKNDDQHPEKFELENVEVTRRLCEALVASGGRPRLLFVSTGLVYGGLSDPEMPGFDETAPLNPHGMYSTSKARAEQVVTEFHSRAGLDAIIARPFNHTGPRQSTDYPIPRFARQIVSIPDGQTGVIHTRDLSSFRDYCDVRDVADAYALLLEKGTAGHCYNVGSGNAVQLRAVLDRLIFLAGVKAEVREERLPHFAGNLRATKCNSHKLEKLGWHRNFDFDATLKCVLQYWKEPLQRSD
ncbi:MAG: NAD-dependent epimerase/dehydratase family protein [Gemmataceae bacterium]